MVANKHVPPCAGMIVCGPPTARLPVCVPAAVWGELDGNPGRRSKDRASTAVESLAFRYHRQRRAHRKNMIMVIILTVMRSVRFSDLRGQSSSTPLSFFPCGRHAHCCSRQLWNKHLLNSAMALAEALRRVEVWDDVGGLDGRMG